jgi:hypothetical protein
MSTKFLLFTFLIISILIPFSISASILARDQKDNECYNKAKESRRSTTIVLINKSGTNLFYMGSYLDHGIWAAGCDPSTTVVIPNGRNVTFANQSHGFATGVEGTVIYSIGGKNPTSLNIYWENPFIGRNSYRLSFSDPRYTYKTNFPVYGNDAYYEFTLLQNK